MVNGRFCKTVAHTGDERGENSMPSRGIFSDEKRQNLHAGEARVRSERKERDGEFRPSQNLCSILFLQKRTDQWRISRYDTKQAVTSVYSLPFFLLFRLLQGTEHSPTLV